MAVTEAHFEPEDDENSASSNAWFQLHVPEDGSRALVKKVVRHQGKGTALTPADILKKLKQLKVCHGIDLGAINNLLEQLEANELPEEATVIACSDVSEGEDGDLKWLIDGVEANAGPIIVAPDMPLAKRKPAVRGTAGKNVFGKSRQPRPVFDPQLSAGEGIRMEENDEGDFLYLSNYPGLLDYSNDTLQIDSMVRLSDDHMTAHMDIVAGYIEAANRAITEQDILVVLDSLHITEGIHKENIRNALKSRGDEPGIVNDVLVAEGRLARDGVNARLLVDDHLVIGKLKENGQIDFHEKSYPWNVKDNEIIGSIVPPQPEENGYTVSGRVLEAEPALGINLELDGLCEDQQGKLRATRDGVLLVSDSAISVADSLLVEGDVCHRTGNIHSSHTVLVKGYVEPGFILESKGDVVVQDNVEQSEVRANANVVVKAGIRGSQSRVVARGDIKAGFVENARIKALGNITVENSLVNCYSFCQGMMTVGNSRSKKGTLIGGTTHVVKGITAENLGSEGCSKTVIRAGINPGVLQRYRETAEELEQRKRVLDGLLLKYKQKKSHASENAASLELLANACRVMRKEFDQLKVEHQVLHERLEEPGKVRIVVHHHVYPGVRIEILDHSYEVRKKENAGMFFLEDDLIIFRPAA